MGIIGRNGAGKSTILKILSGITYPTSGEVYLRGRVGSLLEVGTGFHPELTGRENIFFNGSILGMTKNEISKKFEDIVSFSGIEKYLDTPIKRYSSGMQMRLAFAVASHLEPEILLIDEVLAVGDAEFQKKCLGKMGEVAEEGRTVLFVSHNMSLINRLCPRSILLEKGEKIADGLSSNITHLYLEQSGGITGIQKWPLDSAPGTPELKLLAVRLLNQEKKPAAVFEISESVTLQIEYYVGKPNLSFRCAALFYTQGVLAFVTLEPKEEIRNIGINLSEVKIPGNLLAENNYYIGISIFSSRVIKERYIQINDVIAFQVYDSLSGSSARGDYVQRLSGILSPILKWDSYRKGDF
jgi:lipopolysaccharide transport system ATP-binding protein